MKGLKLFLVLLGFLAGFSANSQVDAVQYWLKYDTTNCTYDAYIIVTEGSAFDASDRLQFNAQYSLVVPHGSTVALTASHMPLKGNTNYDGINPMDWILNTDSLAYPPSSPTSDFYSITPDLSIDSRYNDLYPGDTIKLFSLDISPTTSCASGIRIWENGSDPNSAAAGMNGRDFNNGITIGSIAQLYDSNAAQSYPLDPIVVDLTSDCSTGIEIDLNAYTSTCQGPLTYSWTGPNGYTGTTQDVNIVTTDPAYSGTYTVDITDAFGCTANVSIYGTTKPNAGPDVTICAGTADTIAGTNPTNGVWRKQDNNPVSGATLASIGGGQAKVTFSNSATGTYCFIYDLPGCSDTMCFAVNPKPIVSITGDGNICAGDTSYLSPTTGGIWSSSNNGVASVNNAGVVVGLSSGTAYFTFTDNVTGCSSTTSTPITVNEKPNVSVSGPSAVCIGSTTNLMPNSGGTWTALTPSIAAITAGGVVTGITTGTASFIFTENITGCVSDTAYITVKNQPVANITGNETICIFNNTTLSPSTGGVWTSNHPFVASVTNAGVVTGLQVGIATFTFTDTSTQCSSLPSDTVTVDPGPNVGYSGKRRVCEGETANAFPSSGGTWASSNINVATITNDGVITAVGQGQAIFTFTDATTGCTASITPAFIVDPTPDVSSGQDSICIDAETTILPLSNQGIWTNHTPTIVQYISNGTKVKGLAAGKAKLTFKATSGGCVSDTLFIVVEPRPTVSSDDYEICVGSTAQLTPNSGGSWTSSDDNIASVTNQGLVTGKQPGLATFTFTSSTTLCTSDPTAPIEVKAKPPVSITGDDILCTGETTNLSPSTGGTWQALNPGVATVLNNGLVTAVGPGVARFRFTNTSSGCISDATLPVTVNDAPDVNFSGPSSICIGSNTEVLPQTGGIWSSSDTSIAKVTNAGIVTGYKAGTVTLNFTETATGCTSANLTVTILPKPTVSTNGVSELCIGATAQLSPSTGGSWTSSNSTKLDVTSTGLVTAIAAGTATFTFTSDAGCPSDASSPIVANSGPTLVFPDDAICIGDTITLSPVTGTWTPSNTSIVDYLGAGKVVGLAEGTVTFSYVDSITGCSSTSGTPFTVNPKPVTSLQDDEICVGAIASIAPFGGGTWTSTDTSVATIGNNGSILGVGVGKAAFIYTRLATGCSSDPSDSIEVTSGPTVSINDTELCIGETTTLTPATGGTWTSNKPLIASVSGNTVTALAAGVVKFTFVEDVTGCTSETGTALLVNGRPTTVLQGDSVICIGGFTNFTPTTGGTWTSSNAGVATIDDAGLVTGIAVGTAVFTFTETATGCPSLNTGIIRVTGSPDADITGPTTICIGGKTTLSPTAGGTWVSSDPTIATVKSNGEVTSLAPGKVTFTFTETATGCTAQSSTDTLTIESCVNPDFNVTYVDIPVPGNVSTNDGAPAGTNYGPGFTLKSKPSGSTATLTLGSDGTYSFVADKVGVYVYDVPVCIPPLVTGCQLSALTITVLDHLSPANGPVANVDFGTTDKNVPIEIFTLANDGCLVTTGCSLDATSVSIVKNPSNGSVTIDPVNGNTTYTPGAGYVGLDTLRYKVCVDGDLSNCAEANQIITVNSDAAPNSTVAVDDFNHTQENKPVSGNVSTNDSDPEGDTQTVAPYSITVGAGTLDLLADGEYTFTPTIDFFGPVEFVYTTCDDNTNQACAEATLHILVVPDLYVNVRAYIEGALMNNGNAKGTTHTRPLMRDGLRKSIYNGNNYIPTSDPYEGYVDPNIPSFPYQLFGFPGASNFSYMTSKYNKVSAGDSATQFKTIANPTAIFGVTGEDAIVDWIWVELRSKNNDSTVVARRSGLLQRDGDIVDLDGQRSLRFPGIPWDDYYVTVRHRSHLGAMTANPQTPKQLAELVDFTTPNTPIYDKGVVTTSLGVPVDYTGLAQNSQVKSGYYALWAGDFDGNGKVKVVGGNTDMNEISTQVLTHAGNSAFGSNYDFAYGYRQADYDLNAKVKFDNPDDDKNMLFATLLFYPLNVTTLAANYDLFIEQLPEKSLE